MCYNNSMSLNLVKKKNREGKTYVYLVEVYRDKSKVKHRTIESFGQLEKLEKDNPNWFEEMKNKVKTGDYEQQEKKELVLRFNLEENITKIEKNFGYKILDDIFNELKIKEAVKKEYKGKVNLIDILKLLVFERIINPQSKLATVNSQTELFGDWNFTQNDIYRALEKLEPLVEDIQLTMHKQISKKIGREATLVFYDVTNYYFETDEDDEFRKRGVSKEKRPNPIVQMGLFIDNHGIPIAYKLFPGNNTDTTTYIPAIKEIKEKFGIERIVVVADKAMNSKKNIKETLEKNDGWIFSQKHRGTRGAPRDIQEFILNPEGWLYNEELTFAKKSMIREREIEKGITVKEKVLVTWSKKYAIREKLRRDGAIEYAEKLTNAELFRQTAKKGEKKYLELYYFDKTTGEKLPFIPIIEIDNEQVLFDEQFDGVNVLVASELDMSDEAILEAYGQLFKIEDCFRITKSELKSRPIWVRKKESIQSHFLTCFIALTLERIIEYLIKNKLSSSKIIKGLRSAVSIELPQGYEMVQGDENFIQLLNLLKIDFKKKYIEKEKLTKFSKGWFTTFLNS